MLRACVILAGCAAVVPAFAAEPLFGVPAPVSCPAGVETACGANSVCCPIFMSQSGMGCCHLEGGVCCPKSPTTQMCCPKGTTCAVNGYGADCVPDAGGKNESGIMVCTPGAKLPPSSSKLPSVIVIGDSVSEGIEPVLGASSLSTPRVCNAVCCF
jgi:hypothetical protein